MKKELLIATAVVGTMGVIANSAQAASATFSGHTRAGVKGVDKDSAADTYAATQLSSFSVSISETTDSGIKISTGFDLTEFDTLKKVVELSVDAVHFINLASINSIQSQLLLLIHQLLLII